ncbi:MAG: PAS domain S-box protein [Deltaproteobacteria bacterium]|nr:PAS domain S-box protein [Deltaproteobacteria bacterium]
MPASSQPQIVAPLPSSGDTYARFLQWLVAHQDEIIDQWVERLTLMSPSYRRRPTAELFQTVTEAFRANLEALESGNLERIDRFIDFITEKRLHAGFPLSDVQKAFELFRELVVTRLCREELAPMLPRCLPRINSCLAYTIHRFSDCFQGMHERYLRQHAHQLERQVSARTAELAESERRYKALVDEINDGYFIVQGERIMFANQTFCQMHGAEIEGVLGQRFSDFVISEDRALVMGAVWEAMAKRSGGGQVEYDRAGCPEDNAATEIKFRVVDLGQGPVTIGVCRDISQRVAMEATIREHERMAYVGNVAASLSHEIRNPLSTCTLNMLILNQKLDLGGFDRRRLELTVRELTRLEDILRQLLDLARPLSLNRRPSHLPQVAKDCLDLLASKMHAQGIKLYQRHAKGMPPLEVDPDKIEQALLNLLLNAIESVDSGGRITVWTRQVSEAQERWAELGVHDNGPGIDPKLKENLFAPFATNKIYGTGLGLSNVKRVVEAHGGKVLVKSRPGLGATFMLRLPWTS